MFCLQIKRLFLYQTHLATGTASGGLPRACGADMQFPEITDGQGNKDGVSEGCYLLV